MQNNTKMTAQVAAVAWRHSMTCSEFTPKTIDALRDVPRRARRQGPGSRPVGIDRAGAGARKTACGPHRDGAPSCSPSDAPSCRRAARRGPDRLARGPRPVRRTRSSRAPWSSSRRSTRAPGRATPDGGWRSPVVRAPKRFDLVGLQWRARRASSTARGSASACRRTGAGSAGRAWPATTPAAPAPSRSGPAAPTPTSCAWTPAPRAACARASSTPPAARPRADRLKTALRRGAHTRARRARRRRRRARRRRRPAAARAPPIIPRAGVGRRPVPAARAARLRRGAARLRAPHRQRQRLRAAGQRRDRAVDLPLSPQRERLARHRLQLPRRPLRADLRGPRGRHRPARDRRAGAGLQRRLDRRGEHRHVLAGAPQTAAGVQRDRRAAGLEALAARRAGRAARSTVDLGRRAVQPLPRRAAPVTFERIAGHRDADQTACPGDALFAQLPEIRAQAAALAPQYAFLPPPRRRSRCRRPTARWTTRSPRSSPAARPAPTAPPLADAPISVQIASARRLRHRRCARRPAPTATWAAQLQTQYSRSLRAVARLPDGSAGRLAARSDLQVAPRLTLRAPRRVTARRSFTVRGSMSPRRARVMLVIAREGHRRADAHGRARPGEGDAADASAASVRLRRPALHRLRVAFAGDGRNRAGALRGRLRARRSAALTHALQRAVHALDTVRTQRGNRRLKAWRHSAFARFRGGRMSTTMESAGRRAGRRRRRAGGAAGSTTGSPTTRRSGRARGKKIAKKNLVLSIFAEHLGFSIWVLWTIVVINLANAGFTLSLSEQFLLIALPEPRRLDAADPLHVRRAEVRRARCGPAISASLLLIPVLAAGVPRAERLAARAEPRDADLGARAVRRDGRPRRRQLLLLDGEHLVLLSRPPQGRRARASTRRAATSASPSRSCSSRS